MPPPAVFLVDGQHFVPTDHARGPWDARAQHGGAPAGLLARAIEAVPSDHPVQVARLTIELLRPVPISPLAVRTEVIRPGRKVQLVEGTILSGDTPVVRAVALRIRTAELRLPESATASSHEAPAGPDKGTTVVRTPFGGETEAGFHTTAMEVRSVVGGFAGPGPSMSWFRLRVPLVESEDPSPLVRVAVAADFGNGISWVLPFDGFTSINPDLTIYLHRLPAGEWVGLDSRTYPEATGVGICDSALYDTDGRIGRAVQGLIHEGRDLS